MKLRVHLDGSEDAVGGKWDEIGQLQFEFIRNQGLDVDDKLLDIGCGTLRGGWRFIEYLRPGNYTGIDISPDALKAARDRWDDAFFHQNTPRLEIVDGLTFDGFTDTFDVLLAQSVLTHTPPETVRTCLENVGKVMDEDSVFFATFFIDEHKPGPDTYSFSVDQIKKALEGTGLEMTLLDPHEYPHPRGQRMVRFEKATSPEPTVQQPQPAASSQRTRALA